MRPALLAASGQLPKIPPDWAGWAVIVVGLLVLLRWVLKILGVVK